MPEIPEQPLDEGLDYLRMWATLREEFARCCRFDVQAIHPYVIIGYMNFLQQIAAFVKKDHIDES